MVRQGSPGGEPVQSLINLRERLIREGPQSVNAKEKLRLLWDGETVFWLHQELWSRPGSQMHPNRIQMQSDCAQNRLLSDYLTAN